MKFRRGGSVTENLTVAGNFIGVRHFSRKPEVEDEVHEERSESFSH
jgi:hypothetical protein